MAELTMPIEARDMCTRKLLNCVLSDAQTWFERLGRECAACRAVADQGPEACAQHEPDNERAEEQMRLSMSLWEDDLTSVATKPLSPDQIRVLREALPLAIARRRGSETIEDVALMAAYQVMATAVGADQSQAT